MIESGIPDSENPYLYDMSGVNRKVIDYSKVPLNEDLDDYDLGQKMQDAFVNTDGSYAVKGGGERFKLGGMRMVSKEEQ